MDAQTQPKFEIVECEGGVAAWVAVRPPYEPIDWQLDFRNALQAAVGALRVPRGSILVARYTSALRAAGVDAENVLLYNVRIGASAGHAIRFQWALKTPVAAPTGAIYPHALLYTVRRDVVEPLGQPVARITGELDRPPAPELKPHLVWHALKCGALARYATVASGPFALRVTLGMPRLRGAANLAKASFDGSIAALQHDLDIESAQAGAHSLAQVIDAEHAWLVEALSAPGPLGGVHTLVRRSPKGGLAWNPRDEDCMLGEIRVVESSKWTICADAFTHVP